MALVAECQLQSVAPYSQSRHYTTPEKTSKETPDAYERRTWRERMHYDEKGQLFIPNMAFKWGLTDIAKFLGEKIPGKGRATYAKHFEAGILIVDNIPLYIYKDEVPGEELFVPSDGRHGSGSRVTKIFPLIKEWRGVLTVYVLDREIQRPVFESHLSEAGRFMGVGRWRPQNGGAYGRYKVLSIKWTED